jgi:hypothetical protein
MQKDGMCLLAAYEPPQVAVKAGRAAGRTLSALLRIGEILTVLRLELSEPRCADEI